MLRVTFVGERGHRVRQHWLDIPMGSGWIASYQLAYKKGQARILEVRVVPDAPGRFPRTVPRPRPYRAFSFDLVRRQIRERTVTTALASLVDHFAAQGLLDLFGHPSKQLRRSVQERRGAGRPPKRPDVFYARLAVEYHGIEHHPRREPGASTRKLLASRHHVPKTTIPKWLQVAGQKGFLTKARKGQRGRMATAAARRVVAAG